MKHWSIRTRIIASFGLVLALMAVMAAITLVYLSRIDREARAVQTDSVAGLVASSSLRVHWAEEFVLVEEIGDQSDPAVQQGLLSELVRNRLEIDQAIAEYENTIATSGDRQLFEGFKSASAAERVIEQDVVRLIVEQKSLQQGIARLNAELLPAHQRGTEALRAVQEVNKRSADAGIQSIDDAVGATRIGVMVTVAAAVILAFFVGVALLRAITRPLTRLTTVVDVLSKGDLTQRVALERRDELGLLGEGFDRMLDELTGLVGQIKESGTQVSTAVTEIAATARQQQATATEVAATTTEIGATSREISATSKELVRTMNDVSTSAEESAALGGEGRVGLTQMEEIMRDVMDAAGSVNSKLTTLNEKAGDISQVVTTITKVADQTNLLSLNAAIEAEKAGEYGRGFAVVATEIRRLADQTAVATYDIEQMIKAIQSAVSAGVMSMDKFSEEVRRGMQSIQQVSGHLGQVIQQVQALAPRFEVVTEGMQAQATGAEQITEALGQLSEAAQQTVESLRQSQAAIDGLTQVATGLRTGVARFSLQRA